MPHDGHINQKSVPNKMNGRIETEKLSGDADGRGDGDGGDRV